MSDINQFLFKLRKSRGLTLREAAERSGLSHSYISSLENGKHPKTRAPINPSPESLKGLSRAYNYPYDELMVIAGHMDENKNKTESENSLPKSEIELFIKDREEKYGVLIKDDPVFQTAMRNLIDSIAQTKADQQNSRNQE